VTAVADGINASESRARYQEYWRAAFDREVSAFIGEGAEILDVGAGRKPTFPASARPADCRYVGLDISPGELTAAGPSAYDETVIGDVSTLNPALANRFDCIVSWQVFEHVEHLGTTLDNLHKYLRPGGGLVAQFSGRYSIHGVVNRLIPHRSAGRSMEVLLHRKRESVFRAHYDACYPAALERLLDPTWSEWRLIPRYKAGDYFAFSPLLRRIYLAYEDRVAAADRRHLASHYILVAQR
jgi:cyclopropane fatty-acyl-phospholipid synthase-like methyltransferase